MNQKVVEGHFQPVNTVDETLTTGSDVAPTEADYKDVGASNLTANSVIITSVSTANIMKYAVQNEDGSPSDASNGAYWHFEWGPLVLNLKTHENIAKLRLRAQGSGFDVRIQYGNL